MQEAHRGARVPQDELVNGATAPHLDVLLAMFVVSLAALVYAFLRMSGVLGGRGTGRPPPQTPMG